MTVLRPFSAFRHSPAIDRLAIRGYSYETECDSGACGGSGGSIFYGACGGPCSTENVTAFPQSVGMGATWNVTLERAKGEVIGRELRSIAAANRANYDAVYGLSCFSPMINIIRDPFWGRNSEGYSECPHLTGEMAHSVVTGMQGDDPRYVQVVAGCKHFVPCEAAHLPTTPLCSMRWSNPHHPHPPPPTRACCAIPLAATRFATTVAHARVRVLRLGTAGRRWPGDQHSLGLRSLLDVPPRVQALHGGERPGVAGRTERHVQLHTGRSARPKVSPVCQVCTLPPRVGSYRQGPWQCACMSHQ